jgi:hypothetical protein
MLETYRCVRRVNCGIKTHLLAVCAFRLIIPLYMYTITIKRRVDNPFLIIS